MDRVYCCIDLKSYFASVECVSRGLDPFKTNLIVADPDRSGGTVCLAVSPAMKEKGVKNRCRLYEIPNGMSYVIAKPRMKLYMEKSAEIYSIYMKYVSPDDIHVYSVDECFFDLTDYLKLYEKTPKQLAKMLIDEVYLKTGIRATVGIGTNLFLAKVALDVTAKHSKDYMGYLDVQTFKKTVWKHRPITDIWNVGHGIAKRLERLGVYDLYGVTQFPESILYKEFGVNAELLIDHANGIETCTMADIHAYRSKTSSISNGQILFSDYSYNDALIILKEMVYQIVLELTEKGLATDSISLYVGYAERTKKGDGGTMKLPSFTSSYHRIIEYFSDYFARTVDKNSMIRRINVGLNDLQYEIFCARDLFYDLEQESKEAELQKTVVDIKKRYGKNALLRGTNFEEKATARERNKMIGGHNGGEEN